MKSKIKSYIFLIPLVILLGGCISKKNSSSVGIIDMRYLLECDMNNTEEVKQVWDELHSISTLQGIVNRDEPSLYIKYIMEGDICIDEYWWNKYRCEGNWLAGKDTFQLKNIDETILYYKNKINGVVVYDPHVASTSNVASAIAGIENLMAIRYDISPTSLYSRIVLKGLKLPVKVWLLNEDGSSKFTGKGKIPGTDLESSGSSKNDPYLWFIEKYMKEGKCTGEFGGYYI